MARLLPTPGWRSSTGSCRSTRRAHTWTESDETWEEVSESDETGKEWSEENPVNGRGAEPVICRRKQQDGFIANKHLGRRTIYFSPRRMFIAMTAWRHA